MIKVNVLVTCLCISVCAHAQIGIGTDLPDESAALDIRAENLGLLIPRVFLTGKNDNLTIPFPANSLIVYNQHSTGALMPGYHYWDSEVNEWVRLLDSETVGTNWSILGNTLTLPGTNFIGTTDNVDLLFKRNNIPSGLLNDAEFNTSFGVNSYQGIRNFHGTGNTFQWGRYNTAVGYNSLTKNMNMTPISGLSNTAASHNTALGAISLAANTTGEGNVALGSRAMESNQIGKHNVAVGYLTLNSLETSNNNVALGAYALQKNTERNNVAVGFRAMRENYSGYDNAALGTEALEKTTKGIGNVALGTRALVNNLNGDYNTAAGYEALIENQYGKNNTAIGYRAGPDRDNLVNTTAIGFEATVTRSNTIRLGNNQITNISGQVGFSTSSDRRLKESIKPIPLGIDFIQKLLPVEYVRKNNHLRKKEWGLIAQDLQATLDSMGYMNAGIVQADNSEDGMLSVRYTDLIAPIVKSIQELSAYNAHLKAELQKQLGREDKLAADISELKNALTELLVKKD